MEGGGTEWGGVMLGLVAIICLSSVAGSINSYNYARCTLYSPVLQDERLHVTM